MRPRDNVCLLPICDVAHLTCRLLISQFLRRFPKFQMSDYNRNSTLLNVNADYQKQWSSNHLINGRVYTLTYK
jgi:hypothetical protein